MRSFKKIISAICSIAMLAGIFTATVANAAEVATPYVTLSGNYDTAANTYTITFNTTLEKATGGAAYVKVPENLKQYISSWKWADTFGSVVAGESGQYVGTGSVYIGSTVSTGTSGAQATNGYLAKLELTLVDGGIPATVKEADRTITIGGERRSTKYYAASVANTDDGLKTTYAYIAADSNKAPTNYWTVDPAAAGNYVVLPTAAPAEKHVEVAVKTAKGADVNLETPNYNYNDVNKDVAVAFMATVTPNDDTVNGLTWTVKSGDVEKTFTKNFDGTISGATAVSYGLIIKGIDKVQAVNAAASVVAATE